MSTVTLDQRVDLYVDRDADEVVLKIAGFQALRMDQNTALTLGDWIIETADRMGEGR